MFTIMIVPIFILSILDSVIYSTAVLDNDIRRCRVSDPNLDLCVKKLLEGFQNTLWYGDYTNDIPPLAPLVIGNVSMSLKMHHVDLDLDLINIKLHTCAQLKIEGVRVDDSKRNYTIILSFPILSLGGKVHAAGSLYDYKGIFGTGRFKLNSAFQSGKFPDTLKIAKVIAIFKIGNEENVEDYRPIAKLNTFSKILENDTADIFLRGTIIRYKGIRYLQFVQMTTKMNINNFCIVLDMDWGSLLSSTTSKMFNLQQDEFIKIITPLIEKRINEDFKQRINQLIAPFPLDSIFTD